MQLTVKKYSELYDCVRTFQEGAVNLLFIVGDKGFCKTSIVRATLPPGRSTIWVEAGALSAYQLYLDLYENRDKTIILDDCDHLYTDRATIRLMKSLCQTEAVRRISWNTHNLYMEERGIPRNFETRSRVVVIANRWNTLNEHVQSLEDRGLMVSFEPTVDEVLRENRRWFDDREVLDWVDRHRPYIDRVSMRALVLARDLRRKRFGNWEEALETSLGVKSILAVERLLADGSFHSDEERVAQFHAETGKGRSEFFGMKRRLAELRRATPTPPPVAKAIEKKHARRLAGVRV